MPKFLDGVLDFQKDVYPQNKALFEALDAGQSPEALFITCADSRIDTGMLTQTKPGDIFVCRNAGNIVPPHSVQTSGIGASIEFATTVLKVAHIVVCGHSGCGAMTAAMDLESVESLPSIKPWLSHCTAAVSAVNTSAKDKSSDEKMTQLIQQNVLLQIEHLKTHPCVKARLKAGDIQIHGWVYDIKTGGVMTYDPADDRFKPLKNIL